MGTPGAWNLGSHGSLLFQVASGTPELKLFLSPSARTHLQVFRGFQLLDVGPHLKGGPGCGIADRLARKDIISRLDVVLLTDHFHHGVDLL